MTRIELEDDEVEGGVTAEEYAEIWKFARLHSAHTLQALLVFAEMLATTNDPLSAFTHSQSLWFHHIKNEGREEFVETQKPNAMPSTVH